MPRWLWLIGLLLGLVGWWKFRHVTQRTLCDITLLLGVSLAPFGWSYDHVVVLPAVLSMVGWMILDAHQKGRKGLLILLLLAMNAISYAQRLIVQNDLWFFWLPLGVLGMYGLALWQLRQGRDLAEGD